eukprot:4439021-Amphidinium_carterae.3
MGLLTVGAYASRVEVGREILAAPAGVNSEVSVSEDEAWRVGGEIAVQLKQQHGTSVHAIICAGKEMCGTGSRCRVAEQHNTCVSICVCGTAWIFVGMVEVA